MIIRESIFDRYRNDTRWLPRTEGHHYESNGDRETCSDDPRRRQVFLSFRPDPQRR